MFKKIFLSEFGKGAITLFILINIFNFLNFLFHFSMARLLGPSDYGILAVLMSIMYILYVPSEAIQNLISKYTSKLNIKKEDGKIKFLIIKSMKRGFKISLILFFLLIFVAIFLYYFLEINFWLIIFTNSLLFFFILIPILRGVLQGKKKFNSLGISLIIEGIFKLIFSIFLVIIGWKVFGAMIGIFLALFGSFIITLSFNKKILHEKEKKEYFKDIRLQSIPYFISNLVIFLMLSIDIILAKRFFSADIAGKYAALSMLGKMIFFATSGIGKAMFPLTSENHDNNKKTTHLFYKSLFIITSLGLFSILIYALFPKLIVNIFWGKQYIEIFPLMVYSGIAFTLLAMGALILIYSLSISKLKTGYWLFIFIIIEIILLSLFHHNLLEYILALMVSNITMFLFSFLSIVEWRKKGLV